MNIKIYLHEIGWIILIRKSGFLWLLFAFFWIGLLSACDSEKLSQDNQVIQAVNTTIIGSKSPSTVTVGSVTPTLSLTTSIVTTTGTPTISQNRNNSRLNGISCRAPCWEDITPGKTSLDEAIKLLEKNPYVIFNSIKIEPPPSSTVNPKSGFLVWKWNDGSIQQSRITYDYQNLAHTVKIIYLAMFEAKLGDIIQVYGSPSHVEANNVGETPSISLLWLSQGLGVSNTEQYKDKPPIINASLTVKYVRFFTPTTLEKYVEGGVVKAEQFVSWQGYKDFGFYCNLSMLSHRC